MPFSRLATMTGVARTGLLRSIDVIAVLTLFTFEDCLHGSIPFRL